MRGGRALPWVAGLVAVALVVAIVVVSGGAQRTPFDTGSSAPDGYGALRILLEGAGSDVVEVAAADLGSGSFGRGDTLVVPVEPWLSTAEAASARAAAEAGAIVVLGAPEGFFALDDRILTRTPAQPWPRGFCDIVVLEDLVSIDVIDVPLTGDAGDERCFADGVDAAVTAEQVGAGTVVRLSSPYLWANARLQPDKERGGEPLDNGPMAVALLASSTDGDGAARPTVTFVRAEPSAGTSPEGTRNPVELLPFGVQLALVQALGAFLLYAWWRSRRLGAPVAEEQPVDVAGSELVEALGGLLRRAGSTDRAGRVLRAEARRELGRALGLPPGSDPGGLVAAVVARTGRPPEDVAAVLLDGPVGSPGALVDLTRSIDSLSTEVLDGQRPVTT